MPQAPLLPFTVPCLKATFLQRVKRFSIELEHNGQRLWAHSNNSGSMAGLLAPGNPALISVAPGKNRKLPYTLELVQADGVWVGVNTSIPNKMLAAAFTAGRLPWADGYTAFKREARCEPPHAHTRLDALLTGEGLPPLAHVSPVSLPLVAGAFAFGVATRSCDIPKPPPIPILAPN